ncbi:MAG: MerR family transcriptional regulator [Ilumatobacteraceae bacterium]
MGKSCPGPTAGARALIYRAEHREQLELILELRDRGLTLTAIKNLVTAEHPIHGVRWLGVGTRRSWSADRPKVMARDERAT